jgi:hypothetical protein
MIIMVIFGFFFLVGAVLLAALVIGVIGIMYRAGRHFRESNAARRAQGR